MKIHDGHSAYLVELSVGPGGARWAELHTYSEPAHVHGVLRRFCANRGGEAYYAISYGATLGIWVVQRGEVVDFIDLHPFLRAELAGESAPLADRGRCDAMIDASRRARWLAEGKDPEAFDPAEIDDVALEVYDAVKLRAEWDALAARLPALEAPRLEPGQRMPGVEAPRSLERAGSYLEVEETVRFGSYDVECGGALAGPIEFPALGGWEEDEEDEEDEDEDEVEDEDEDRG